jgi:hypothetical protein
MSLRVLFAPRQRQYMFLLGVEEVRGKSVPGGCLVGWDWIL